MSLERAREYDRVSEILAANNVSMHGFDELSDDAPVEFGIEGRRIHFDKNSYRQPVLTEEPMLPRPYRWGQPDPLATECIERLKSLQDYALMTENAPTSNPGDGEKQQFQTTLS